LILVPDHTRQTIFVDFWRILPMHYVMHYLAHTVDSNYFTEMPYAMIV